MELRYLQFRGTPRQGAINVGLDEYPIWQILQYREVLGNDGFNTGYTEWNDIPVVVESK